MIARLLSKPVLLVALAALAGMVGMVIAWATLTVATTLYQDHLKVQQIWAVEVQRAQQQQAQQAQQQAAPK